MQVALSGESDATAVAIAAPSSRGQKYCPKPRPTVPSSSSSTANSSFPNLLILQNYWERSFTFLKMPLYQMFCISKHYPEYVRSKSLRVSLRPNSYLQVHIRELIRQSATHVMNQGGVVRKIESWGTRTLPQRMKRQGPYVNVGECVSQSLSVISCLTIYLHRLFSYWSLYFDTSPRTLRSLNGIMRRDPRVLRWTVLKLADKVEDIAKEGERLATGSNSAEDIAP